MAAPPPEQRERPALARRLDRLLTAALKLGGRLLARPNEPLLHELTGRSKGGEPDAVGPGFPELLQSGRQALSDGHLAEAMALFAQAAEQNPDDPWPWHGRGDALQLSGEFDGALGAYDAALERDESLAISWSGRGNALEGLGRLDEAAESWRRALVIEPGLRWALEGLARTER